MRTWRSMAHSKPEIFSNRLAARHIKALSHVFCAGYEYSLWIDGSLCLIREPYELIEQFLGDADLAGYRHPRRDCVYQEIDTCKADMKEVFVPRDDPAVLEHTKQKYLNEDMPEHYGLIENGFLLRRHTPEMIKFNDLWWDEIQASTTEDQLVMMYCLWKAGLKWTYIEPGKATDNPYVHFVGHCQHYTES